tara:strand:- start:1219 stop:1605 length:387 start_codon:yes stop_codon:yes gene_type:complete
VKEKLFKISEVAKELNLIDNKNKKPLISTLRFWEKQFSIIKPIKLRGNRYYSKLQVENLRLIKFLLKDKGLTIKGAKDVLKKNINTLDAYSNKVVKNDFRKYNLKDKAEKLLKKIKEIKYGKKNTYKS